MELLTPDELQKRLLGGESSVPTPKPLSSKSLTFNEALSVEKGKGLGVDFELEGNLHSAVKEGIFLGEGSSATKVQHFPYASFATYNLLRATRGTVSLPLKWAKSIGPEKLGDLWEREEKWLDEAIDYWKERNQDEALDPTKAGLVSELVGMWPVFTGTHKVAGTGLAKVYERYPLLLEKTRPFFRSVAEGMAIGSIKGGGEYDSTLQNMAFFGLAHPTVHIGGEKLFKWLRGKWFKLTVKERGLVLSKLDNVLRATKMSKGQVLRKFNQFREEALNEVRVGEKLAQVEKKVGETLSKATLPPDAHFGNVPLPMLKKMIRDGDSRALEIVKKGVDAYGVFRVEDAVKPISLLGDVKRDYPKKGLSAVGRKIRQDQIDNVLRYEKEITPYLDSHRPSLEEFEKRVDSLPMKVEPYSPTYTREDNALVEEEVKKLRIVGETGEVLTKELSRLQAKFDVEAPFREIGALETGFNVKNRYSVMSFYEDEGLDLGKKVVGTGANLSDVALFSEEGREIFLPPKLKKATSLVKAYFKRSFSEIHEVGGLERPFKEAAILRYRSENEGLKELLKNHPSHPNAKEWKEQITENLATIRGLKNTDFVHLPVRIWFQDLYEKKPHTFGRIFQILSHRKRTVPTLRGLVKSGLVKKEDVNIVDIIGSYARRKGQDVANLKVMRAMEQEGLAFVAREGATYPENYIQLPTYKYPALAKYRVHPAVGEYLERIFNVGKGDSHLAKVMNVVKGFQFYNPFILPTYDLAQGLMLGSMRSVKTPVNLARAMKSVWKKDETYRRALLEGLASKPFNNPWKNYEEMVNAIKTPFYKRLFNLSNLLPTKWIRGIYNASWHTAWKMDETVRLASYNYLMEKGFSPRDAAQIAAKFHGDYASIPSDTRRELNKIFFTPTFKIAMFKLHKEMISSLFSNPKTLLGFSKKVEGKEFVGNRKRIFLAATAAMVGINMAFDSFMTHHGFKRDQWGRRYYRDVDGEELVITFSHPANLIPKYYYRVMESLAPGEDTFVSNLLEKNRWEVHPLWRVWLFDVKENKKPSGGQIYSFGDDNVVKGLKVAWYVGTQYLGFLRLLEETEEDKKTSEVLRKEFGPVMSKLMRPFTFAYTRKNLGARKAYQIEGVKRSLTKEYKEGGLTERQVENYTEQLRQLSEEIENGNK